MAADLTIDLSPKPWCSWTTDISKDCPALAGRLILIEVLFHGGITWMLPPQRVEHGDVLMFRQIVGTLCSPKRGLMITLYNRVPSTLRHDLLNISLSVPGEVQRIHFTEEKLVFMHVRFPDDYTFTDTVCGLTVLPDDVLQFNEHGVDLLRNEVMTPFFRHPNNPPRDLEPEGPCPDCKGTKMYVGLQYDVRPCPTCCTIDE